MHGKGFHLWVFNVHRSASSRSEGENGVTCYPVADASTERLVKKHSLDWCLALRNKRSKSFEVRHRQDGIEAESRNWCFVQGICAQPDATQASGIQECELEGFTIFVVRVGKVQYELDGVSLAQMKWAERVPSYTAAANSRPAPEVFPCNTLRVGPSANPPIRQMERG